MKKVLFSLVLAAVALNVTAQQPLVLLEEFSNENNAYCARINPGLWRLVNAGNNTRKIILIKYQMRGYSAGPVYNIYPDIADARTSYYNVTSAPSGYQNGTATDILNYRQAQIDAAAGIQPPFNISAAHSWSTNADSIYATIDLSAVAAFAPANAQLKLRVALIESLKYCRPPGSNGEKEFHHVVRDMYP